MKERAIPILPSRDLHDTLRSYERLGFQNQGGAPDEWDYLIIGRGGIELHFFAMPEIDPLTTSASCYLWVEEADALHAEWGAAGVPTDAETGSRLIQPMDTEYGMREFAVVDRSGNLVRVGSPLS